MTYRQQSVLRENLRGWAHWRNIYDRISLFALSSGVCHEGSIFEAWPQTGYGPHMQRRDIIRRVVYGVVCVAVLAAIWLILSKTGLLGTIVEPAALERRMAELGVWGPAALIGIMALAIVVSPLPSAPIAMAAGAAYGHFWGTIYVIAGAEIGALIAFCLARFLGYRIMHRWFGNQIKTGWLGSQNMLTWLVFVSRLIPFISFDVVSYAAGLTPITTLRFAIATLFGLVPAAFLLTHFGGELASEDPLQVTVAVLALGMLTAVPFLVHWLMNRRKNSSVNNQPR